MKTALALLKIAIELAPELGVFLSDLLASAPADHPLVDDIRAILPIRSETDKALDALEGKKEE